MSSSKYVAQTGICCYSVRDMSMTNCIECCSCDSSLLYDNTNVHNKNYNVVADVSNNSCLHVTMYDDTHIVTPGPVDDNEFLCIVSTLNSKESYSILAHAVGPSFF